MHKTSIVKALPLEVMTIMEAPFHLGGTGSGK